MKEKLLNGAKIVSPLLLCAGLAFGQNGPFSQVAQGASQEIVSVGKWVSVGLCVVCGIGLMTDEGHKITKIIGLALGAIFALFATPIMNYIQAL